MFPNVLTKLFLFYLSIKSKTVNRTCHFSKGICVPCFFSKAFKEGALLILNVDVNLLIANVYVIGFFPSHRDYIKQLQKAL
jgi:hypothetical protein